MRSYAAMQCGYMASVNNKEKGSPDEIDRALKLLHKYYAIQRAT